MAEVLESPTGAKTRGDRPRSYVRIGAKAIVRDADRILLVKERHADGTPFWTLPGGGVHPEESLEAGLRRELVEELRCRSAIEGQIASFRYRHSSVANTLTVYAVFDCALRSAPDPSRSEGIEACRWVRPSDLPVTTLAPVRRVLEGVTGGAVTR